MSGPLPIQHTHPAAWFEWAQDWIDHDGTGQPVDDDVMCKVRYSNGHVCNIVTNACTWRVWTSGRDFWKRPEPDDRLWIVAYVRV